MDDTGIKLDQYMVRRYDWAAVPTLRHMLYSRARHQFVIGPFSSGKSSAMVMKMLKFAQEQVPGTDGIRRSRWAVVRNVYRQLDDTTLRTVKYWVPEIPGNVWHESKHIYSITSFPGIHLELLFRALDRPDHVANLLSLELTGAWLNEFREIHKDIYEALDGRVDRYPPVNEGGATWAGILGDSNPPSRGSYWYRLFEELTPRDPELARKVKVWKQPSGLSSRAENLKYNSKGYYDNLTTGKDQLFVDVYVHGKYGYIREGKPVFDLYNDNYHVSPILLDPVPDVPIFMGWDFALNPTCVLGQLIRGQLRILDEAEGEDMGIERMIDTVLMPLLHVKYRGGYKFMGAGDPTGTSRSPTNESTCYSVLKSQGFTGVHPAPTNALTPRLSAVNSFLTRNVGGGEPGLLISPHCSHLREALSGGYCYAKIHTGDGEEFSEEPKKNRHSHIADALQALCQFATDDKRRDSREERLRSLMQNQTYRPADAVAGY